MIFRAGADAPQVDELATIDVHWGGTNPHNTRVEHHRFVVEVIVPYLREHGRCAYLDEMARDLGVPESRVSHAVSATKRTVKSVGVVFRDPDGTTRKRREISLRKGL